MIKRLNLLLLPAAFLFTTGAIFFPQGDQPAEAVYKNIKVFKGTPAKDILPAMQFMSASLKVNCGFCHAPGDFASDAKEEKGSAVREIGGVCARLRATKARDGHTDRPLLRR